MSSEVKVILSSLMAASSMIRQCKTELLNIGFTEEETQDLLQFYVYDKVNEEDF